MNLGVQEMELYFSITQFLFQDPIRVGGKILVLVNKEYFLPPSQGLH